MYEAMTIVVGKDMATENYVKSYDDFNLEENTEEQSISIENEGEYEELLREKRHLPLVHKRGNIEREIACMKMMVLKSCLNRLEM
jgi:hypothetical protein